MSSAPYGWKFARQWDDEGSSGGTPAEYALDTSFEGLIREIWQNLNDEGPIEDGPVEAIATVRELEGEELETFLRTLGWTTDDTDGEALWDHLKQAGDEDTPTARFLDRLKSEKRLVVLTVEDRNTRGLLGEGGDGKNFSALALDELHNDKRDSSGSGGSFGLGKFVCPAWSGISTVLYSSSLSEPDPKDDDPRVFGHAYLPTHGDPDEPFVYEGDGYFGRLPDDGRATVSSRDGDVLYKWGDGNGRPVSLWGDDGSADLLSTLGIPRSTESSGTSVTILGVCPPGKSEQPDPEELGTDIAEAVSKWFWPAIATGQLATTVETPNREIDVKADHCRAVRPFVDAFRRRGTADEHLKRPGDVAIVPRDIEIPDKTDGESTADGPIEVCTRLADPTKEGASNELLDQVALIRGAGMVVKYYDQSNVVYGDRHFHGLVLAGRARAWNKDEPTESDVDIDDYLKAAEPPSHDDWKSDEGTRNQAEKYGQGYVERVRDLKSEITAALKDMVSGMSNGGELVAPELADRFGITGRGAPPESQPVIRATERVLEYDADRGIWEFGGRISPIPDDHYEWAVDVNLDRLAQNGRSIGTIDIAHLDCDPAGNDVELVEKEDGYRLKIDETIDAVRIEGVSKPDDNQGLTRLDVLGEVVEGGDE